MFLPPTQQVADKLSPTETTTETDQEGSQITDFESGEREEQS